MTSQIFFSCSEGKNIHSYQRKLNDNKEIKALEDVFQRRDMKKTEAGENPKTDCLANLNQEVKV